MSAASIGERRAKVPDAELALRILAVDPGLGLRLRGPLDPVRDTWLAALRSLLPAATPWRVVLPDIPPESFLAGTDAAPRAIAGYSTRSRSFLAGCEHGVVLVPGAERILPERGAMLAQALDRVQAATMRPGLVLLDEDREDEDALPSVLAERVGMDLDLRASRVLTDLPQAGERRTVTMARRRLPGLSCPTEALEALCAAGSALGIGSLRAPGLALRIAKASAALAGRRRVAADDVAIAARLCLAPRARCRPAEDPAAPSPPSSGDDADPMRPSAQEASSDPTGDAGFQEAGVVAAALASLPPHILRALPCGAPLRRTTSTGRSSQERRLRAPNGRPSRLQSGKPRDGLTVDLAATLRAALPWQALRGRQPGGRLRLRAEDVQVAIKHASPRTTTIFVVDASGSAAHGRLAEAKGAVELLLSECYIRRDEIALVAFRGTGAKLLLSPTRSLARAKRELADLPGGGGTPLASGIDLAAGVAQRAARDGRDVFVAVLTDGRANIARDGRTERGRAEADALAAAAALRAAGLPSIVIDVSPRPSQAAARLADAMSARYLPLPQGAAQAIAGALRPLARSSS